MEMECHAKFSRSAKQIRQMVNVINKLWQYAAKLTALPQFNCSTERVKKLVHRLIIKFLIINHGNLLGHNLRKVTNPPYC